jgi:hypothetical protein
MTDAARIRYSDRNCFSALEIVNPSRKDLVAELLHGNASPDATLVVNPWWVEECNQHRHAITISVVAGLAFFFLSSAQTSSALPLLRIGSVGTTI